MYFKQPKLKHLDANIYQVFKLDVFCSRPNMLDTDIPRHSGKTTRYEHVERTCPKNPEICSPMSYTKTKVMKLVIAQALGPMEINIFFWKTLGELQITSN